MTTYMYPTQIIITNMLIAGTADSMCYNYYCVTYCCTIDFNNLRLSLLFVKIIEQRNFVTGPYTAYSFFPRLPLGWSSYICIYCECSYYTGQWKCLGIKPAVCLALSTVLSFPTTLSNFMRCLFLVLLLIGASLIVRL